MAITLAKALKLKNRLVEQIRKVEEDIRMFNSRPSGADGVVDVEALFEQRQNAVKKLIELKQKIITANGPIREKILTIAKKKAEIDFLKGINTSSGKVTYQGTELLEYKAAFTKNKVDTQVTALEAEVDALQDNIDQHNYTTSIEFEN
jgi:hypothetical protein